MFLPGWTRYWASTGVAGSSLQDPQQVGPVHSPLAKSLLTLGPRRIRDVCARHNVPLKAAALQLVLAHPAVTSVIPGSSYPEHVHENVAMIQYDIPSFLWNDLRQEGLIDECAPIPS
jgi:D-threo-aldose 1-dehydrogenase